MLPTIDFFGKKVSRLICGGNPFSGFSHTDTDADREMVEYYTMPNLLKALDECWANGINTFQSRGDRHQIRMYLEHRLGGGKMQWLAQTASERADIIANVREIAAQGPIAIYHHGTRTDNSWHAGRIEEAHDIVKAIKDTGLPAGIGSHIPEVIEYAEEHGWETDFYMCCFYNLARQRKPAVAVEPDPYRRDEFPEEDPPRMTAIMRKVKKPCLGFKILAAGKNSKTPEETRRAFDYAFDSIKSTDAVVVGMFQKHKNQIAENAEIVKSLLA